MKPASVIHKDLLNPVYDWSRFLQVTCPINRVKALKKWPQSHLLTLSFL